jgi:hypothetical protein
MSSISAARGSAGHVDDEARLPVDLSWLHGALGGDEAPSVIINVVVLLKRPVKRDTPGPGSEPSRLPIPVPEFRRL